MFLFLLKNPLFTTKLVYVHREQRRLFQFLMGLRDEFELARSHILHQDLLPTISQAIHKLVDNETRLQTEPVLSKPWFLLLHVDPKRQYSLFFIYFIIKKQKK